VEKRLEIYQGIISFVSSFPARLHLFLFRPCRYLVRLFIITTLQPNLPIYKEELKIVECALVLVKQFCLYFSVALLIIH
jgi:hypothetical protein